MIYQKSTRLYRKFIRHRIPWESLCEPRVSLDLAYLPVCRIKQLVKETPPSPVNWHEWCTAHSIPCPNMAAFLVEAAWRMSPIARLTSSPMNIASLCSMNQQVWFLEEEYDRFAEQLVIVCREIQETCIDRNVPVKQIIKKVTRFLCECSQRPGKAIHKVFCWTCHRSLRERKKDRKHCARCGQATYCSEQCQAKDWPCHKSHCSLLRT